MTTVTCQRSRIVSPAGIVPIRRYIFVAFRDFFPKTAGRRTASENDQASITRGPTGKKNGRRRRRCRDDGRPAKATRYRFSVIFSGLRHLTAFRHYQEPISMSRLFIPRRESRGRAHRRAFVCRRGRRPDAAWISWKSGGVVQREIRPARGKIKTHRLCLYVETLCASPCVLRLFEFDLKLGRLKIYLRKKSWGWDRKIISLR